MFYQFSIAIDNHTEVNTHTYAEEEGLIEQLESDIRALAKSWASRARSQPLTVTASEEMSKFENRTDCLVLVLEHPAVSDCQEKHQWGYYNYGMETVDDNETIQSTLSDFNQE